MPATYEAHFQAMLKDRDWAVQRFEFATELAFLVTKPQLRVTEEA